MRSRRRAVLLVVAALALALVGVLAQPDPPPARANIGCEAADGGIGAAIGVVGKITGGAIGGGNPVGDLCDKVSSKVTGAITAPISSALKGVGGDAFKELTKWVAQGAGWLMGQVVGAIDTTTTPHLENPGFLSEYAKMSAIAVLLGVVALLAAILEGIAQGNAGLMLRAVLVNAPVAFLGTSVAFVVVQLLVGTTDSLCHAITTGTGEHGSKFFEAAIEDLRHLGGAAESIDRHSISSAEPHAGEIAAPLFVGFLLAIVGAFAGFFVWLELLFRDAAIYAVSLFMPFALYASISPRWRHVVRRYGEILFAAIESKFVIVAIISLAAALFTKEDTSVEVVLVAAALMCLACFAPFVLFRMLTFSEGALAASAGRRSAGGGTVGGASRTAHNVRSLANMARSGGGAEGSGVRLWNAKDLAGSKSGPGSAAGSKESAAKPTGEGGKSAGPSPGTGKPARPPAATPGTASPGSGQAAEGAGSAAGGAGPAGAAAAVVAGAAKAPKKAAERLSETGVAKSAGQGGEAGGSGGGSSTAGPTEKAPRPDTAAGGEGGSPGKTPPPASGERPPRPPSQRPADTGGSGEGGPGGGS
jgi:hypothetical protein